MYYFVAISFNLFFILLLRFSRCPLLFVYFIVILLESAKKAKTSKELELDEKRIKSKERYKMLDQRRKAKRPRAFGKRLAKKLKTKAKERSMQQRSEKENADHKEKGAPKDKGASKSKKPASKTKK